jgi:hypothetical protein
MKSGARIRVSLVNGTHYRSSHRTQRSRFSLLYCHVHCRDSSSQRSIRITMLHWLSRVSNTLRAIYIHWMISLDLLEPLHRPSLASRLSNGEAVIEILLLALYMRERRVTSLNELILISHLVNCLRRCATAKILIGRMIRVMGRNVGNV